MEIVDRADRSTKKLVQVAVSESGIEAALIRGLLEEQGIHALVRPSIDGRVPPRGSCRIWARPDDAAAARKVLEEAMVEEPPEEELPEPVNAAYLARAGGHDARVWALALGVLALALALVVLLVLH